MKTLLLLAVVGCSTPPIQNLDPAPTPQELRWPEHVGICSDPSGTAVACMPLSEYAEVKAELARAQSWIRQASIVMRDECGIAPTSATPDEDPLQSFPAQR